MLIKFRCTLILSLVLSLIIGFVSPALAADAETMMVDRPVQSSKKDEPQTVIEKSSESKAKTAISNDYLVINEKTEQIGTGVQLTTFEIGCLGGLTENL